jgi:hypothetical protein
MIHIILICIRMAQAENKKPGKPGFLDGKAFESKFEQGSHRNQIAIASIKVHPVTETIAIITQTNSNILVNAELTA